MVNRIRQLIRLFSMAAPRQQAQTSTQPAALRTAAHVLELPQPVASALGSLADPFQLLASELTHLKQNIKALVGSDHATLNTIAKYYLASAHQGKLLRPLIVLLISQATATTPPTNTHAIPTRDINLPISPPNILNDSNPNQPSSSSAESGDPHQAGILPTQRRLAEIAELIHVSSLLHDDVIDQAETRRGQPSAPREFGSKLSVLAGDFLLARASLALSRLGNFEVIELISSIISNLVEGELIQLESILKIHPPHPSSNPLLQIPIHNFDNRLFDFYQRKNYLKTASLMAKTCRATVLLSPDSSRSPHLIESSYQFGKHLGLAFQIVDDILDYTSSDEALGKTGNGSDLKAGLITAPGLYAWKEHGGAFGELVSRKFVRPGDLELAQMMVKQSDGIRRSYDLAAHHIDTCRSHLAHFPDSDSKQGLYRLCNLVLERNH
ncbi:hypothetical protein PCANC_05879 [Puccinia coronata f. sp. avenae]|uniref:(2E,6E)-farnesyl diphosphate synthase n=1 Tax=Puccinia coronata f. sp. avenae TaxID=200324 RepID=A0A2N5VBN9_9BASI|nr:hypothetical protein PCANC_05879 [Puccinia coronata f. sp. avenae]PLW49449.1 hypothetical protein PCASD_01917 [Puccinia coronata f. sp. avenae]